MKSLVLTLLLALLAGCSGDKSGPIENNTLPRAQTVVAGYQHINWAWGYRHEAIYLDRDGNLLSVTYAPQDSLWLLSGKETLTIPEMNRLLAGVFVAGVGIPHDTILAAVKLSRESAKGPYSDTTMHGADMGEGEWFGYTFDATTSIYHRVILKVLGDWNWENRALSAQKLVSMIERYRVLYPNR